MKKIFFVLALFTLAGTSCKKYDEGPAISLYTKKHRIINSWVVEQVINSANGNDITDQFNATYANYNLNIGKDDSYSESYLYGSSSQSTTGHWRLTDDKVHVYLTPTNSGAHYTWEIHKLKEKSLWVSTDMYGGVKEVHFKPQ